MIFSKIANYYISRRNAAIEQSRHGRIAYIDLIKGILILTVIYYHTSQNPLISGRFADMLEARIPAFMCISFLFFKEYSGFADFATRKFCKLIIPFTTIGVVNCLLTQHSISLTFDSGISALRGIMSTPLWFLYTLFMCHIEYYIFNSITCRLSFLWRLIIATMVSLVVCHGLFFDRWVFALSHIYVNFNISHHPLLLQLYSPIRILPVLVIMKQLRTTSFFQKRFSFKTLFILLFFSMTIWALFSDPHYDSRSLQYGKSPVLYQLEILSLISTLYCVGNIVYWFPVVSYVGRYSIIVLMVHSILFKVLPRYSYSSVILFSLHLGICLLAIPIFLKYLPYLCAQKDLFTYNAKLRKIQFNNPFSKESKQP